MPAVATITEYLRTADEAGRAMVIGILQQTIASAGGEVVSAAPAGLSIKVPTASGGKAAKSKTPRAMSEEARAAKTSFMTDLAAKVKAIQAELECSYKEAQVELAIRKIMEEEDKEREEAEAIYAAKQAEKAAKKEAKAAGLPTPKAKTPKVKAAKTPKKAAESAPSSPKSSAAEAGGAAPAAKAAPKPELSIKRPAAKAEAEEAEPEVDMAAQFEEMGIQELEIDGKPYYVDTNSREVYEIAGEYELGEIVGLYDVETEAIVPKAAKPPKAKKASTAA